MWILELTTTSKPLHATVKCSGDGLGRRKGGSSGSSGEDSCCSCRDGNGAENDRDEKSGELHLCKFGGLFFIGGCKDFVRRGYRS